MHFALAKNLLLLCVFSAIARTPSAAGQEIPPPAKLPDPIDLPYVPPWLADFEFEQPEFEFVRIRYSGYGRYERPGRGRWATDFPDADLALVAQLAKETKLQVATNVRVCEFSDPGLLDKPFAYVAEAGQMELKPQEVEGFQEFVRRGGLVMMDDTFGEQDLHNVRKELKRVFPNQELKKLNITHPIFHCAFILRKLPRSISIHSFLNGGWQDQSILPEYYAILNEERERSGGQQAAPTRIEVLVCHNTDLGDGWERARDSAEYRAQVSAKHAFPMGINAVLYAITRGQVLGRE